MKLKLRKIIGYSLIVIAYIAVICPLILILLVSAYIMGWYFLFYLSVAIVLFFMVLLGEKLIRKGD